MPIDNDYAQEMGRLTVLREKLRQEYNALGGAGGDAAREVFEADNMLISKAINQLRMNPPLADLAAMDTTAEVAALRVAPKEVR